MSVVVRGAGLAVNAFYRHAVLGARVPQTGPVLVVANHTHQLVDVALALHAIERRALVLAKATLFRNPVLAAIVRSANAWPVHRARDGARSADAKRETARSLTAMEEELARGGCVLVFPEGVSHEEPGIYSAHTGAARIAMGAVRRGARDLQIVPLGLLYREKRRPRSEAATLVGAAIAWADLCDGSADDADDADDADVARGADDADRADDAIVDALTARIEDALRDVTLHLEEWEDLPLVQAATVLDAALDAASADAVHDDVRDDISQGAFASLADGIARMRAHDPAALARMRRRVDVHARRLRRIGVRPDESARPAGQRALIAAARHVAGVAAAPFLALAGVLTGRRAWIDRARTLVRAAVDVVRLVAAGEFTRGVERERRALLQEIDALLRASRALPPAPG